MHPQSGRQLLTCRYWAFGPGCPDIAANGLQNCQYAHWDTGRLVGFYDQRGTCYKWFHKRSCPFGGNCSYEHRDTGLMGLHHGVLILHGLNLEIADAAKRSGFNTANQVALMDLIWSVRRVAFRHAVKYPDTPRPPKHPVYPDHYRPGDRSANTIRSKKRGRELETENRGIGASNNPVSIDDDDVDPTGGRIGANSSKRIKYMANQIGRHKIELPHRSKLLNPVHPSKFQRLSSNQQQRGRPVTRPTIYMPSPRSLNLPAPRPSSIGPIFNTPRPLVARPCDRTVVELQKVGNTLRDNIDAVVDCANVMKRVYDHDDRLCESIVYRELETVKGKFDSCLGDAEEGIKAVEKIISLLEDNKENAMRTE